MTVIRRLNRVIVEGVNVRKRAIKPTMDGLPGRMVLQPCSIHYSNVMLIDPSNGEPTKISRKYLEDGSDLYNIIFMHSYLLFDLLMQVPKLELVKRLVQ